MKIRHIDFWPDAWIAGTQGMTLEEEGAYCRMIMRYYSLGEPLPADPATLAKMCNVRPQVMRRILVKLAPKFDETDGKLRSNRCETELKLARNRVETARSNGSKHKHHNGLEEPTATHIDKRDSGTLWPKGQEGSESLPRARADGGAWGAPPASHASSQQRQSKQEAEAAAAAEREAQRQEGRRQALADLPKYQAILDGDPAAVRALKAELAALNGKGH